MANIASAKKRILITTKKELQNKILVSRLKTKLKKYDTAIKSNDIKLSETLLLDTVGFIDNLEHKGILHQNNAARKKSAAQKKFNSLKNQTAKAE